jgi:hypothetical protein
MDMIGIKKDTEYIDLIPGTQIQRERESPVFLTQSDDGKDGIPGEVSYPFSIPLTDKNLRLLKQPDSLPQAKELEHEIILENSGMQLSAGKLIIESIDGHLVKNNVGRAEGYILSNVSEFWSRVRDKKLSELSLGGNRTFTWSGYSTVVSGFWKHVHDSWAHTDSDDGDYVFFPVYCKDWEEEGAGKWMNGWAEYAGVIEMARNENLNSLVPHPYLVYVIKQVFLEHGYEVEGDILDDPDFKQLCLISYRACHWADETLDVGGFPIVVKVASPLASITIRLNEHVPPETTIGEFLVELQKFLPITFIINDTQRRCRIVRSDLIQGVGAKNRNQSFNPNFTLSFDKIDRSQVKVVGFERTFDDELPLTVDLDEYNYQGVANSLPDLPTPTSANADHVYFVKTINAYVINYKLAVAGPIITYSWQILADNQGSYERDDQTEALTVNMTPLGMQYREMLNGATLGSQKGYFPATTRKGNWYRPYILAPEYRVSTPWGMRVMFYRGARIFNQGQNLPFATNHIYNINSHATAQTSYTAVGGLSLSYVADGYGLYEKLWKNWLPILEGAEKIKGTLYLKLHEYLQFDWDNAILIDNTPYLLKKITEILPYNGKIDIEAVRIPA